MSDTETTIVDLGGVRKSVSLVLVPEARLDDYVIVHVGHAIGLLDPEEAQRTLALLGELAASHDSAKGLVPLIPATDDP